MRSTHSSRKMCNLLEQVLISRSPRCRRRAGVMPGCHSCERGLLPLRRIVAVKATRTQCRPASLLAPRRCLISTTETGNVGGRKLGTARRRAQTARRDNLLVSSMKGRKMVFRQLRVRIGRIAARSPLPANRIAVVQPATAPSALADTSGTFSVRVAQVPASVIAAHSPSVG